MTPKNLKSQLIYGIISSFIYAGLIAIVDYYRDKAFDLKKFVIGFLLFGIVMIIVTRIKHNKKEE